MLYVEATGSFEEVGAEVGEASREIIPEIYERGVEYLLKHTNVGSVNRINEIAGRYMAESKRLFEGSVEYLIGQAKGANVPLEVIILTAFTEEVSSEAGIIPPDKCTTLVVCLSDGRHIVLQSEDFELQNVGNMVLLRIRFNGFPEQVCLTYPGQLSGLAGTLNANLIGITNNGLHPLARPGWPKQAQHFRASLARNMAEAERWLTLDPVAVTTHYTVACGRTREVLSLAVSNLETSSRSITLRRITGPSFGHTNHVLPGYLGLKEPDPAMLGSKHSFDRYDELVRIMQGRLPQTLQEGVDLFWNNPVIHRSARKHKTSVTNAIIAFCPETGEFVVRDTDPTAQKLDWPLSI